MKTYRKDEIVNKHGQPIYYWSKQPGNTELEKYRNFKIAMGDNSTEIGYIIKGKNSDDITCLVDKEIGPNGYTLLCFNDLGETILNIDDCYANDKVGVIDSLYDYNIL